MSLGGILCLPNLRHKKSVCKITFLVSMSNSNDSCWPSSKTRNFLFFNLIYFGGGSGDLTELFLFYYYAYNRENKVKVVDKQKKRENFIEQQIELLQ